MEEKIKDEGIEILDIDEKESHAKMRFKLPKIRNKKITSQTIVILTVIKLTSTSIIFYSIDIFQQNMQKILFPSKIYNIIKYKDRKHDI